MIKMMVQMLNKYLNERDSIQYFLYAQLLMLLDLWSSIWYSSVELRLDLNFDEGTPLVLFLIFLLTIQKSLWI